MSEINNIEKLVTHLKVAIIEKNLARYSMLNDVTYIDKLSRELITKKVAAINISDLEKIIKKIGIEEYDIFLSLKEVLDKLEMSEILPRSAKTKEGPSISRKDTIEFILSSFRQLQELSEYEEELDPQIVDSFTSILSKILESLYDKEIERISKSDEYQKISKEVKTLSNILSLVEKSSSKILTKEERTIIQEYLTNSTIDDKISIYVELGRIWLENIKSSSKENTEEESIIFDIEPISNEIIEELTQKQEAQKQELLIQTKKRTKEEWVELFNKTIELIKNNTTLTEEQKTVLEKILLSSMAISSEDLNVYEELLNDFRELNLNSRRQAYLDYNDFEEHVYSTASIDLAVNIIPNLENPFLSEIFKIIETLIEKYNQYYLSKEEFKEIKDMILDIQTNYPNLSYITYTDEEMLYLEEKFIELEGNKKSLINADKHNGNILGEDCDSFIENTFKKIIKTKLEELQKELENATPKMKKGRIPKLMNELEFWIKKYNEYNANKEVTLPYKQYTIEEIQNIDFEGRNMVVFLNGENGMTLYEEGILRNGSGKNGKFQDLNLKVLQSIMKNCVNGGKEIISSYHRFKDYVYQPTATNSLSTIHSKKGVPVKINDHYLYRLSEAATPVRVTVINLKVPDNNKNKIGIPLNNTVVLVISSYEVNVNNDSKDYANMRRETLRYEKEIKTIIDAFENPQTPKETLLGYIASSYGLLEKILGEQEPPQLQPEDGVKIGGRG